MVAELNRVMAGAMTAYCDGYEFDLAWMANLFREGKIEPSFDIAPIEEMPRMHVEAVRRKMNACLDRTMILHRAGEDALHLMQAYVYAIGKRANVLAIG